ncbi:unnamed protein product, partial [marine sediment metagenome]
AGIVVVHGGGLLSAARDYALFLIVLAVASLAGLLATTRSTNRGSEAHDAPHHDHRAV